MNDVPVIRGALPLLIGAQRDAGLRMLSPRERARLVAEHPRRRETFLAGRVLLRRLAGELLDLDPAAVPLTAACPDCGREHGRPSIPGSGLEVSLAHSADAVVAVAMPGMRVGVDLEPLATPVDDLAPLIPHPTLAGWTRIEAVLKADGRGLRVDPAAVRFAETEAGMFGWVDGSTARYSVREIDLTRGVRASVAVESGE